MPRAKKHRVRVNLTLTKEANAHLRRIAREEGSELSEILNRAVIALAARRAKEKADYERALAADREELETHS